MQNDLFHQKENLSSPLFLFLVFLTMSSSSAVLFEPAPVDLGIIFLLCFGILLNKLKFSDFMIVTPSIFLFIFLLASIISMYNMRFPLIGFRDFAITFYLILTWYFYIGLIGKFGNRAVIVLMNGYTIAAVFASIIGIATYFNLIPWTETLMTAKRVRALFKDPNVFGPFLIPVALYAYSMLDIPKKNKKTWWLLVLLLLALGVFLSYSRAAWGNFILAFFIYFILKFITAPSMKLILKFVLTSIMISAVFLYFLSIPFINDMFIERLAYQSYDDGRFNNQALALETILANPFGIGPLQYQEIIGFGTHNLILRVLVDNGIIGFIGFAGFIFFTLYRCWKLIITTKNSLFIVVFASILGILLNSLVVDTIHWRHFWFILALPWACKYHDSKFGTDLTR